MKQCSTCKESKSVDNFHKDRTKKDGLNNKCKLCKKKQTDKYYQNTKEERLEYCKTYRENNREYINERARKYRQENSEKHLETVKRYRENNRENILEHQRKYNQSKKGKEKMYRDDMKRRSYKHKVRFTPHERKAILDRDDWKCQCCGITVHDRRTGDWNTHDKGHIDHIKPISKGGDSTPQNLQTLCRTCNLSKSNKMTG